MQSASPDSSALTLPATPTSRRRARARLLPFIAVAGAVVAFDQLTKALIRAWLSEGQGWPVGWDLIRISHVENSGAAFGILQGAGGFLVIPGVIALVALLTFVFWAAPQGRGYTLALALILGGAVGNLVDRVARGTVTDFIDPTHFPAFNVADSCIDIGIAILFFMSFIADRDQRDAAPAEAEVEPSR